VRRMSENQGLEYVRKVEFGMKIGDVDWRRGLRIQWPQTPLATLSAHYEQTKTKLMGASA